MTLRPRARAGRAVTRVVVRLARAYRRAASRAASRWASRFRRGPLLAVVAIALVALVASALLPEPALAEGWVERAVGRMVETVFAVDPQSFDDGFLVWLISAPNFVGDPSNGGVDGNLEALARTTSGIAFGLIGAVMTFAVIRHWLSGLSELGGDGTELLTGIVHTVGAALMILAWPWIFVNGADVSNQITAALVDEQDVQALAVLILGALTISAIFSAGLALIFGIIIATATVVMLLGLAAMKITISAALAVLFAGMPLALVLWPLPAMSWIPRLAIRAVVTLMLIPVVWALCLATAIAVGFDALSFRGGGGVLEKALIKPMTALALLWLLVTIPRLLMRIASLGAALPGSGRAGQMVAWMGGHFAYQALSRHVPESLGGKRESAHEQTQRRQASAERSEGGSQARPADAGGARDAARTAFGVGAAGAAAAGAAGGAGAAAPGATAAGAPGEAAAGGAQGASGASPGRATERPDAAATAGAAGAGATEAVQAGVRGWRNAAGTFHDATSNLPTAPGEGRIAEGRGNVAALARELPSDQEQRRAGGHAALDTLGAAGYAEATMAYSSSHTPPQVKDRMADASTADGLSEETSGAFLAWGALDQQTRRAVVDERLAAGGAPGSSSGPVPDYPPQDWQPRSPSGPSVDPTTATAPPRDVTDLSDGGSPDPEE